jgi:hypothetical protein
MVQVQVQSKNCSTGMRAPGRIDAGTLEIIELAAR